MKLRTRVSIVVLLTLIGLVGGLTLILGFLTLGGFSRLEDRFIRLNAERASEAITNEINSLNATCRDYANWDETYQFAVSGDEDYPKKNLKPIDMSSLDMNLVIILDPHHLPVFMRAVDISKTVEISWPSSFNSYISKNSPLINPPEPDQGFHGIVSLPNYPVLVAAWPILDSNHQGPSHGTLIFGRFLNDDKIKQLATQTQTSLSIFRYQNLSPTEDLVRAKSILNFNNPITVLTPTSNTIAAYQLMHDIYNNPAMIMRVESSREVQTQGQSTLGYVILALTGVCAAYGLIILFGLDRLLLIRLNLLTAEIAQISDSQDFTARVSVVGKDEIGELAIRTNQMLRTVFESSEKYRRLVEQANEGIFSIDQHDLISFTNQRMAEMLGYSVAQLEGVSFLSLINPADSQAAMNMIEKLRLGESQRCELAFLHKNNDAVITSLSSSSIKDNHGNYIGFFSVSEDITERKNAEKLQNALYHIAATANSAQSLNELFASIHQIVGQLIFARNFYIALYDTIDETVSFPYHMDEYDDHPQPRKLGNGLTEYVIRTGQPTLVDPKKFDELQKQGEVGEVGVPSLDWLGIPLKTAENRVTGVLVVQTYTEGIRYTENDRQILSFVSTQVAMAINRLQMQEALRQSEERHRTLVEKQGEGAVLVDPNENILFSNPAGDSIFGLSPGALKNHNLREFVVPEQFAILIKETNRRRRGETSTYELEITRPDGQSRSLLVTATPHIDSKGNFLGSFGVLRDITERKQMEANLKFQSMYDTMTGVYNRNFFQVELERLQDERYYPLSLLMVDVDGLKLINDHFGHAVGDEILKRTAQVLREAFRSQDIVARIGGDEFVVLLPDTDALTAQLALARIRASLAVYNDGHPALPLSLAMGIATSDKCCDPENLLRQADERMYPEKASKKRQVVI